MSEFALSSNLLRSLYHTKLLAPTLLSRLSSIKPPRNHSKLPTAPLLTYLPNNYIPTTVNQTSPSSKNLPLSSLAQLLQPQMLLLYRNRTANPLDEKGMVWYVCPH